MSQCWGDLKVTALIGGLEGGTRPSLRHVCCVSLTSTEGVAPLVSSTAVVEIRQGDVVQLQVKHCWGAIVVRHEFWAVT